MDSDDPVVFLRCEVERLSGSADEVINVLARLQLTALECGGRIRLRSVDPELLALLELVGLAEVLACREPEEGEERRV